MATLDGQGLIWYPDDKSKRPRLKRYLSDKGVRIQSIWDDIPPVNSQAKEDTGFDTQKPEKLLQRIVSASSGADDLVADFFVGSGSTAVVAEKLGRRWLAVDFGKVGIQVTRTRLVEADARPFVLQNLGNYQRETIYLGGSRIGEVQRVILKLYGATPRQQQPELGVREQDGALTLVYVGYPDRPVTARKVEEMALLAAKLDGLGYKRLVVLGWDYEFNYSEILKAREKARGSFPVAIESRVIPPEVYEHLRKAKGEDDLEKLSGKILFHEKPYLRLSPVGRRDVGPNEEDLTVSLERYVVFDYPVSSEEERVRLQELAKENFHALIEYWAVDWDYDGVTFRSSQQSFRGFKQSKNPAQKQLVARSLASRVSRKSARLIVVRVVDIFGNDASASADVKGRG
jgi:adenine-specific DNA-methyltransferase